MRGQDIVYFIFILILVYLVVINWQGANAILVSGSRAAVSMVRSLQGR